jgi:hypothetical protein
MRGRGHQEDFSKAVIFRWPEQRTSFGEEHRMDPAGFDKARAWIAN